MKGSRLSGRPVLAAAAPETSSLRSRPMLLLERTMYREGSTPFTSVFTVQIHGHLDEWRLRQALERVQAKHPLLRCVVQETALAPRFVLLNRPAPISMRIAERGGESDWQTEACREWLVPFEAGREPLVRLVWLRSEEISELVLVAHHCICDGHSGINLLRELLSAYDQPQQDLGAYEALGAIGDIVPAALLENRRFQRRVRWKANLFRLALFLKARAGTAPKPRIPAAQMYFHRWNTGRDSAQVFTARCKSEGVTVLAAVSVAFMQAFRQVRGMHGLAKTCVMVNARRFLPEMRGDAMFGLAPGVGLRIKALPHTEVSADAFWAQARAVGAELKRRTGSLGAGLYEMLAASERLHECYARLVAFFERTPAVRNLTLSNLGKLDLPSHYRGFRIERVYSPLVMVSPTPANTVVISSFEGDMEFAIVSDEQSLPRAQALEIQQQAMAIFHSCAALPEQQKPARAPGVPVA